MAKIKLGALITDISGSVAGMTFQKSSSGLIMRSKPVNKFKPSITPNKYPSYFSVLLSKWNEFTDVQKEKWNYVAANSPYRTYRNNNVQISGRMYFIAYCKYVFRPFAPFQVYISDPAGLYFNPPAINPVIFWTGTEYRLNFNSNHTLSDYIFATKISYPGFVLKPFTHSRKSNLTPTLNNGGDQWLDFYLSRIGWPALEPNMRIWIVITILNNVSGQIFSVNRYSFTVPPNS